MTRHTARGGLSLALMVAAIGACGTPTSSSNPPVGDAPEDTAVVDTGTDAGTDTGADAAADRPADTGRDSATDTATDVAVDNGKPPVDAGEDAAADASTDIAADVTADVAPDVSPDVPATDGSVDVGPVDVGLDAAADASSDVAADGASDAAADASDAAATGCGLTVDGTLAVPAVGATTTVMTTLNAMGTGGMITGVGCTTATIGGSERIYRLTITAPTTLVLAATAANTSTDLVMTVRRNCATSASEVACNDDEAGTNPAIRRTFDPGEYFVVVDEYGDAASATGGMVTLTATAVAPAANAACAMATRLTAGTAVMGDTLASGDVVTTTCSSFNDGPQLFYTYTIPANSSATFTATPTSMPVWSPFVRVFADCASAATCLTTATGAATTGVSAATFENRTAMERTVTVSVGGTNIPAGGPFTLNVTTAVLPAGPANGTCDTATVLTLPTSGLMGTTTGAFTRLSSFSCTALSTGGSYVFYRATVPAGRSLRFTVNPTTMTFNPAILAYPTTCTPTTCTNYRNSAGAGLPEQLAYTNTTTTDQTVTFAVGSTTAGQFGDFTVDATLVPVPTNTTCATPRALTGSLNGQAQSGATATASMACLSSSTGPVLYYSVTVPAQTRATLTATPNSDTTSPVLRVLEGCGAMTCTTSGSGFSGGTASVTWTNTGMSPITYLVELGSSAATTRGVVDLALTLASAAPAYNVATEAMASCDDLTMGATDLAVSGDDSTSPTTALPTGFAFTYFGDSTAPVTHFSANSNGLAQLHTSAAGVASTSYSNVTLPDAFSPTGALAVLWDDLNVSTTAMGAVRYATLGTGTARRHVIEWINVSPLSDSTARMRFQVKLFETTNVIEYHYCSLTSMDTTSTRHTGSSATIGLQNIARTRGQVWSVDGMGGGMTRSVGSGTATSPNLIRWTPIPPAP